MKYIIELFAVLISIILFFLFIRKGIKFLQDRNWKLWKIGGIAGFIIGLLLFFLEGIFMYPPFRLFYIAEFSGLDLIIHMLNLEFYNYLIYFSIILFATTGIGFGIGFFIDKKVFKKLNKKMEKKLRFIIVGIIAVLIIAAIIIFALLQQGTDLRTKCCQECVDSFGIAEARSPYCNPLGMSEECINYLNIKDDLYTENVYNGCINRKITESVALKLANQEVSEYRIIFNGVTKESAEKAKFVSQLVEECDFSDYNYNEVWVAEKSIGEKEIGGKNHNVTVYVHIGLDGRACREAKLENVIPGVIPIERVFNQIPNTVITPTDKESCEARGGVWEIWRDIPNATSECNLPTADGGKKCTDSNQCESYCQAPIGTEIEANVVGECFKFKSTVCMQEVRNGVADAEWCY